MPEYGKAREVAARLQVSERTLANWRWLGTGPRYVKFGTSRSSPIRYRWTDVEQWLDEQVPA